MVLATEVALHSSTMWGPISIACPVFHPPFFLLHPEGKLFTHHVPKRFINRCDNDFVSVVCSTGSNLLDNLNLTGRVFGNCMTAFIARNAP
jgi:hypothetical protein